MTRICMYQGTYGKEVSDLKGNKDVQFVWMQVGNEKEHQKGQKEQGKRQEKVIADFRRVRRSVSEVGSFNEGGLAIEHARPLKQGVKFVFARADGIYHPVALEPYEFYAGAVLGGNTAFGHFSLRFRGNKDGSGGICGNSHL